ncbi:hypothetical protein PTTG_07153 [Puccinia triticina 1-1 BBBD Race 1]|uniref:Uncharacterized protein n=1 Tax=Puccinia triticina (isolate 1-1 / race 1 (BBBD)) TaxID=630390 RepID=A0A180GGY8_PUCT1|nr:hypothetical protein PTTG_07153 [Puccinia triticina 1-1 BBBD Race 1]
MEFLAGGKAIVEGTGSALTSVELGKMASSLVKTGDAGVDGAKSSALAAGAHLELPGNPKLELSPLTKEQSLPKGSSTDLSLNSETGTAQDKLLANQKLRTADHEESKDIIPFQPPGTESPNVKTDLPKTQPPETKGPPPSSTPSKDAFTPKDPTTPTFSHAFPETKSAQKLRYSLVPKMEGIHKYENMVKSTLREWGNAFKNRFTKLTSTSEQAKETLSSTQGSKLLEASEQDAKVGISGDAENALALTSQRPPKNVVLTSQSPPKDLFNHYFETFKGLSSQAQNDLLAYFKQIRTSINEYAESFPEGVIKLKTKMKESGDPKFKLLEGPPSSTRQAEALAASEQDAKVAISGDAENALALTTQRPPKNLALSSQRPPKDLSNHYFEMFKELPVRNTHTISVSF